MAPWELGEFARCLRGPPGPTNASQNDYKMDTWSYRYSGLQVVSEQPIPEWSAFRSTQVTNADVSIAFDCLPDGEPAADELSPAVSAEEYRFYVPEVGLYRVRAGREILVSVVREAGKSEVRLFLLGSAWGALCYQRGLLVVHASAVRVNNGVVAFCAPPGGGKSSLAAWLSAQGHDLVSDDLCRFEVAKQGPPLVYPSAQRLKLWMDALKALGRDTGKLERDHFRLNKFHVPVSTRGSLRPLPLRAIYVLEWGDELRVMPLSGYAALQRFLSAATYHGELLKAMELLAAYSRHCLRLLQRVPVWELQRPRDLGTMSETIDLLKNRW